MRQFTRAAVVAALMLFSLGAGPGALLAQANVVGMTYTSPHFNHQLQWSSPWFYIEDWTESGSDFLIISDGESQAIFGFTFDPTVDALQVVEIMASVDLANGGEEAFGAPPVVEPLLNGQGIPVAGGDAARAWSAHRVTNTLEDGSMVELIFYFDARILPGGIVLLMSMNAPSYFFDDSTLQGWQGLASTALVATGPAPVSTTAPEHTVQPTAIPTASPAPPPVKTGIPDQPEPTPVPGGTPGEPSPAFAAGPWRVAVRAVDLGETIDYLGLGFVEGSQWVTVYADVTNWSETDAQLDVAGMTLTTAAGPVALDLTGTQSAATLLGLEPANGDAVPVPAGGSTRIVLVYSAPLAEGELVLNMQDAQLPLADVVGRQLDVTDLSTIATPPAAQEGIVGVIPPEGPAVQFFVDTGDGPRLITLAGVEIPIDAACYEGSDGLLLGLGVLYGKRVWLESDPAVSEPDSYYVWVEDSQGNRILLNQTFTAAGLVTEGDLPDAARFAAWIEQSEASAQANGDGIWSACSGQL